MKSRFLASTIFFVLLGFFSTNLFGQISSASSVKFRLRSYDVNEKLINSTWRIVSTDLDTVGHKVQFQFQFETAQQLANSLYTFKFPAGTVLDPVKVKDSVYVEYSDHEGEPGLNDQYAVDEINVLEHNTLSSYSSTRAPSVQITDPNALSTSKVVVITFYSGLYLPKLVGDANEYSLADDDQKNMALYFTHHSTSSTAYYDTTEFWVKNDKADSVRLNIDVGAVGDDDFWPNGDSLLVIDRFGNLVPDFFRTNWDSVSINVASATADGVFHMLPRGDWDGDATVDSPMDAGDIGAFPGDLLSYIDSSAGNNHPGAKNDTIWLFNGLGLQKADAAGELSGWVMDKLYNRITPASGNLDSVRVPIYLGEHRVGHSDEDAPTIGISFDAEDDVDSVVFYFQVYHNLATGTLLGEEASGGGPFAVKRAILAPAQAKLIGTLTLELEGDSTLHNLQAFTTAGTGLADVLKLTAKDVFGDPFDGTYGDVSDSVFFYFNYRSGGAVNPDMTTTTRAGATDIYGTYDRPATRLKDGVGVTFTDVKTGNYGSLLKTANWAGGEIVMSGAIYFGTTSHAYADSIELIAYAKGDPSKCDTVVFTVEPSPPVAWDLTTFKANLADAPIVQGATIPVELPIFALDTAYNKVSNMDLAANMGFLDAINVNSTFQSVPKVPVDGINFLIDNRDPLGYGDAGVPDSIQIDSLTLDPTKRTDGDVNVALSDSSLIHHYTYERTDSSRLNLGAAGDNPMGMRLLYQGVNYKLSMVWNPGKITGILYDGGWWNNTRTIDLGLFSMESQALIDSVESISASPAVSGADTAGSVYDLDVGFTLPAGNSLGPNLADSVVYLTFLDLTADAGIPAGIVKDSVEFSTDDVNYYPSLLIKGQDGDSIAVIVPMLLDGSTADVAVYIRIHGFVNPTKVDTAGGGLYGIRVTTEATMVPATDSIALSVKPASYGGLKLLPPGGTMPDDPAYFEQITQVADTLIVGDTALFKIVLGDKYGNVIVPKLGSSKGIIFVGPDTTLTGKNTVVSQGSVLGTGGHMNDSLLVTLDTLADTSGLAVTDVIGIDSIFVIPAVAGKYTFMVMDSAKTSISDEVTLVVLPTITGSLALVDSLGLVRTAKGTKVDTAFKVTLRDTYGNLLPDSVVRYVVALGEGTFVDSNGVTVTPNDTLSVVTLDDPKKGQASATLKTGATSPLADSIIVEVDVPSNPLVTPVKFYVTTREVVVSGPSVFVIADPPDSLEQDTLKGVLITAEIRDNELVKKVYLRTIVTALVLDTETGLFSLAATSDTALVDSTIPSVPVETVNLVDTIPAQDLATQVVYDIKAIDNIDSVTWSDQGKYLIAPKAGKQDLTADPTTVADLMRGVYLFLSPPGLTKRVIDYLGLDLDQNGIFDIPNDVNAVLALWRGDTTSALLASAAEQENRSARVSLAYEAVDKANAVLSINLENQGNLNLAGFRVKYDVDKFVFGEVKLTERLEGIEVQFSNDETEGVYSVVVLNLRGRPIVSGSGAILIIPVSAVGDKFDGEGEISLLEAGFERGVATDIDAEALSPKAILPKAFALSQNYPNPFNPSTTIAFDIPEGKEVFVRLNVYNIRGQLVRTLVNETINEGSYKIEWDAKDNNGRYAASGVYFYRIKAGEFSQIRKMVILK